MHVNNKAWVRGWAVSAMMLVAPLSLAAQQLPPNICDFDVADDLGRFMSGSTLHLTGRAGASSNVGEFEIVNADNVANDVDHDGYNAPGPQCDFTSLFVPRELKHNLINVANPTQAIPFSNIILINFPHRLPNGDEAAVQAYVELPKGTAAGRYVGDIQLRDSIYGVRLGPTNQILAADRVYIEVTVVEDRSFTLVNPDSAVELDSVVIRGRAGQRATGVMRIANTGNVDLSDVRITATDLRSESAVGIVIPAQNISFSPASLSGIQFADTARITVTVQIPRGILGGRYRGSIIVQGANTPPQQIPLIVIVTSSRGILFGNNPVREINGDIANIAFNGDPGTAWRLTIYDMAGLVTYKTNGTVYAGTALPGTTTLVGADFAVNVIWPLRNNRGEGVASGMYLVVVESIVSGQRQLAQDKLMVIR